MRTVGWEPVVPDPAVGLGFDVHAFSPAARSGSAVCCSKKRRVSAVIRTGTSCATRSPTPCSAPWRSATWESTSRTPIRRPSGLAGGELLGRTLRLLADRGRAPVSMDVTVVCERPPIAPRRLEMRDRLASISGLPVDRVSVKATRPEGLGLTGEGIGCLALAVVA